MNSTKIKVWLGKLGIKTIGQTSRGIRIVTRYGLTSGVMLDYIYRNKPEGYLLVGHWLDKIYLSHAAWEDVRIRKNNLEQYLKVAIQAQRSAGRRPVILDVAAGAGRYILDILSQQGMNDVQAFCQDLDAEVLQLGQANAAQRGINSVQFKTGDAFKAESLSSLEPHPNIAVSSGFYDWINDDALVRKSMSLLRDILPENGCFLFTNQCRHVSQEFAQSVFSDLHGNPLRMTLRPASQVNQWVEEVGFKILRTTGDEKFNYSVTLAIKTNKH